MDTNDNRTKRLKPARKADAFHAAWKQLAPDATFAGKTLAEFEAAIVPLKDAMDQLDSLTVARSAAVKVRDQEEQVLNTLLILIAHGVRSHVDYGEDSPLYRAMGFVPKSERNSGLTRRNSTGEEPPPGNDEAAV